jgi:hypothetical protein
MVAYCLKAGMALPEKAVTTQRPSNHYRSNGSTQQKNYRKRSIECK